MKNRGEEKRMADLIKRDAALKGYDTVLSILDSAVNAVSEAKAIVLQYGSEPEQQWISCSETIDIPDHEVLCCDRHGEELIGWLSYNDDQWLCESDGEMMYDPVAWREKPEPYGKR